MEEREQPLHSEETEDILKKPPAWIIKWGITMFVVVLAILASLTFIIHYPDLVKTRMVIYTAGSPGPIRARTGGRLIRLLTGNNQPVKKGEPMAFIDAPISHEDVLNLSDRLDSLKSDISRGVAEPDKKQLNTMEHLKNSFSQLFRNDNSFYWQPVPSCINCRALLVNDLDRMIDYTENWKKQFIVSAIRTGTVSVIGLLAEGQLIKAGQPLFYITTSQSGFYGELAVPQQEIAKVKKGRKVLVKLAGYRYEDFGIINGSVDTIGELPYSDSTFVVRVTFERGYNKNIVLKNGLSAEADIVSEDISLAKRLINTLKKAINPQ